MHTSILEIAVGAVIVLSGVIAAFLSTSGADTSILLFSLLSALILATAAVVLALRLRSHSGHIARDLRDQLPVETIYRLRGRGVHSASVSEMLFLLGDHIRDQQLLLDAHFSQNVFDDGTGCKAVTEADTVLQLLRGELTAIEEQFDTDAGNG